jgi:hypothetical protein
LASFLSSPLLFLFIVTGSQQRGSPYYMLSSCSKENDTGWVTKGILDAYSE